MGFAEAILLLQLVVGEKGRKLSNQGETMVECEHVRSFATSYRCASAQGFCAQGQANSNVVPGAASLLPGSCPGDWAPVNNQPTACGLQLCQLEKGPAATPCLQSSP